MFRRITIVLILLMSGLVMTAFAMDYKSIDLSGQWAFQLDPDDKGKNESWYSTTLAKTITLPGSMNENGYGFDITVNTEWTGSILDSSWFFEKRYEKYRQPGNVKLPFWLTPNKHYIGAAWYQKKITIPQEWKDKRILLSLERCHWETQVWLENKKVGIQNSLSTPHVYDLTGYVKVGENRLTICVDNRVKIAVGQNAHSVSDHTQTNWNGIIGDISLQVTDKTWIKDVQVYPNIKNKTATVRVNVGGVNNISKVRVNLKAHTLPFCETQHTVPSLERILSVSSNQTQVELVYPMSEHVLLWDEFSPNVYELTVTIRGKDFQDSKSLRFGMREFSTKGSQFTLNDRTIFLRGTLDCGGYPITGYPPTDKDSWVRIMNVVKDHGLNHIRFHSWCPPEAAFDAADQMGIIFQVECGVWANQGARIGDGLSVDQFVYNEGDSILKRYGNHPSFCMLAYGNEPAGKNQKEYLVNLVNYWKGKDSRRIYTGAAAWPILDENQYQNIPEPRIHAWGAKLNSRVNASPYETITDYKDYVEKYNVPIVSHEIGQWCVFPDIKEIEKYTGVLKARNFEIVRDQLEENHMLDQAEDFLLASGKLQALLYKEEIESALRTPGFGGFQLLDLHDFPGQGTALIGILNAFWGEKGYISANEFSHFCNETVPLLRMEKCVWTTNETFEAHAEIAHFGRDPFYDAIPEWKLQRENGSVVASGQLKTINIPIGNGIQLGDINVPLSHENAPAKLLLTLSIKGTSIINQWDLWIYPANMNIVPSEEIVISHHFNESTKKALENGENVLLIPELNTVDSDVPPGFSTIFWNTAWTRQQPPHTLGVLCDPKHPALADFPTDYHSNWQWWDLIHNSKSMILDKLPPDLRPIIQVIDDWNKNRRLGLVFEAKAGKGKLLVASIDLQNDVEHRPVAKQLLASLLNYIKSDSFDPRTELDMNDISGLFKTDAN